MDWKKLNKSPKALLLLLGVAFAAGVAQATAETPKHKGFAIAARRDRTDLGFGDSNVQLKMVLRNAAGDAAHSGVFTVAIELTCDPVGLGYPNGVMQISINMSDSIVQGLVTGISFEQVTSAGKHSPTAYLNGRCKAQLAPGCRFWLTLADNKPANQRGTPDVIGFLILDGTSTRVAYGTGPSP